MTCCNHNCRQGSDCPRRRAMNLAGALAGHGALIAALLCALGTVAVWWINWGMV